jgi:hypothetical protein
MPYSISPGLRKSAHQGLLQALLLMASTPFKAAIRASASTFCGSISCVARGIRAAFATLMEAALEAKKKFVEYKKMRRLTVPSAPQSTRIARITRINGDSRSLFKARVLLSRAH